MTNIINLTPHAITEVTTGTTFPPSGTVARVACDSIHTFNMNDTIPVFITKFGDIQDLPAPQDDVIYIVSLLVKQDAKDRDDLVSPGTLVRDDKGNPIGCKGFNL